MVAYCSYVKISKYNDYWLKIFLYWVESGALIAPMVRWTRIYDTYSWSIDCGECSCWFSLTELVVISSCSKQWRYHASVDIIALIPGTLEVYVVSLHVSPVTAGVAWPLGDSEGVCMAFCLLPVSVCISGMMVYCMVCSYVILASVSSTASQSAMVMADIKVSTMWV